MLLLGDELGEPDILDEALMLELGEDDWLLLMLEDGELDIDELILDD